MSVIVSPLVKPGERLPKSAFYPYLVATTTKAARDHAIERWHLPHWMEDVEIEFAPRRVGASRREVAARRRARRGAHHQRPLLEPGLAPLPVLHEGRRRGLPGQHRHGGRAERARGGDRARIKLHDHPFNRDLVIAEVYEHALPRAVDAQGDARPSSRSIRCRPSDGARSRRADARGQERRARRASALPRIPVGSASMSDASATFVVFNPHSGKGRAAQFVAPVLDALSGTRAARPRPHHRARRRGASRRGGGRTRLLAASWPWAATGPGATSRNGASWASRAEQQATLGLVPGGTGCDLGQVAGHPSRRPGRGHGRIVRAGHTRADRRGTHRGPVLPEHLRVRLRHRGARGLLDGRSTSKGELLYLYCAVRQLGSYPGLRGRDRGRRGEPRASTSC